MKHLLRSILSTLFYLPALFARHEGGGIVLMYHRVNDDLPADGPPVF